MVTKAHVFSANVDFFILFAMKYLVCFQNAEYFGHPVASCSVWCSCSWL